MYKALGNIFVFCIYPTKKRKARLTLGISPDSTRLTGVKAFSNRATTALSDMFPIATRGPNFLPEQGKWSYHIAS